MKREPPLTGPIDLLVLAVVARGAAHGYAIAERLRTQSGGLFDLAEGTIYPALYRLERAGHLSSSTARVAGRIRRTYRLTGAGREALRGRAHSWRELVRGVEGILRARPARSHAG